MKKSLVAIVPILLLASCNKNTEDRPVCLLGDTYGYLSYYGGRFPNAFTPNGDGKNDRFRPLSEYASGGAFTMTILDKNNNTLFETDDPNTGGWDGKNSAGELAPAGRYAVKVASNGTYQEYTTSCVALLKYGSSNCIPQSDDGSYYFEDMYDSTIQSFSNATREVICPR